ncbi:MAG: Stealth CR1 domain-containing protein [Erysipelotrichaceae bacterium]|nr:Stealth CR1 domain-containing protein [Erysipelotrichaceae bacterium]
MAKIDVVIPWVDGSDPEWIAKKAKYTKEALKTDDRPIRYRDWEELVYIFRGIETNIPWVRKVFLITEGHVPSWLNEECKKLVHVKHSDYIPKEYLPTFSSHPIELNMHRIEGLSERFIYFNDDMFVLQPLKEEMFFKEGRPVYPAILHAPTSDDRSDVMPYVYLNNNLVINRHFKKEDVLEHKDKWFSLRNGYRSAIENRFNSRYPQIIGFYNSHLPTPFLKSTLQEVWDKEGELLDQVSSHRFRSKEDVSQYLFRCWDLAKGNFEPIDSKKQGKEIDITEDRLEEICRTITERRYPMICLNDTVESFSNTEFDQIRTRINRCFESIYPAKSGFEKQSR